MPLHPDAGFGDAPRPDEVSVTRGGRRFAFACPPGGEAELIGRLRPLVDDPACPLTWFDAAQLCHQLRGRLADRVDALGTEPAA